MTRAARAILTFACLAACLWPGASRSAPRAGGALRYWTFDDGRVMRNPLIYFAPGPFHAQLEWWDFDGSTGAFRPEVGLHGHDRRRGAYELTWLHQRTVERFTLGTEQPIGSRSVLAAAIVPQVGTHSTRLGAEAGADFYWGSLSYAGLRVSRDARGEGLWAFPVRARLLDATGDGVQVLVVPASRGALTWGVEGRWRWLRVGYEHDTHFDFTPRDAEVFSVGFELMLN